MSTLTEKNKELVQKALDEAFNKRDLTAYDRYWSQNYLQHSAKVPSELSGLRDLMSSLPPSFLYEPGLMVAEGDYVMVHGRYSGLGLERSWIIVDIFRIEDGLLKEHWDVIQDEVSLADSASSLPMFGSSFPD